MGSRYQDEELGDKDTALIDQLLAANPWAAKRLPSLDTFLTNLLKWHNYHQRIRGSRFGRALNIEYRFYVKNAKEGYVPFPSGEMKRWNGRYFEIVRWLCDIGVMKENGYNYKIPSKEEPGRVRYYKVSHNFSKQPKQPGVKELFASTGMSIREAASQIGCSPSTVSRWLNGKSTPNPQMLSRLTSLKKSKE